jgi:uncharacterized membrane protein
VLSLFLSKLNQSSPKAILKVFFPRHRFFSLLASHDLPLLGLWMVIGGSLRFTQLIAKPLWTDEFATLVFSLGNDYQSIPLNQVISLNSLLQPLQPNPDAGMTEVVSLLLHEDNHPPLYFLLAHWWMKLFPPSGNYVDLWSARSLPALLGVLSIPAIYILAQLAFRSPLVGQLSAALMAVSPYAVFLAQEARHYTLAILLAIASLGCLTIVARHLWQRSVIPLWLACLWIGINSAGITVHYFFCLTLCAEAMALILLLWHSLKIRYRANSKKQQFFFLTVYDLGTGLGKNGWRLGLVVAGTMMIGLAWVFFVLPKNYGSEMTAWIRQDNSNLLTSISPLFQILATWITMLSLLPIESSSWLTILVSGAIMLFFWIWAFPILKEGLKVIWQHPDSRLTTRLLGGFIGSAIAIFLGITYLLGLDITRGSRYSFVYFPAVIVLLGASLAVFWDKTWLEARARWKLMAIGPYKGGLRKSLKSFNSPIAFKCFPSQGRTAVMLIWLMGLCSAITVCMNLGYQKYYRPDLLISLIEKKSFGPVLIATTQQSLVETGEMMGIAWELREHPLPSPVSFLLVHQAPEDPHLATAILQQALVQLPRPFDLWAVNFHAPVQLNGCVAESESLPSVNGYSHQLYRCQL